MGRFFSAVLFSAVLLCPAAGAQRSCAQPVFFSLLFPQLIPEWMLGEEAEVVQL